MFCFSKARCADSFRSSTAFSFGVRSSSYSCMSSCVCAERKPRPWNPAAFPFSTPNLGHDRRSTTAFGTFVVYFATRTDRTDMILCPASSSERRIASRRSRRSPTRSGRAGRQVALVVVGVVDRRRVVAPRHGGVGGDVPIAGPRKRRAASFERDTNAGRRGGQLRLPASADR